MEEGGGGEIGNEEGEWYMGKGARGIGYRGRQKSARGGRSKGYHFPIPLTNYEGGRQKTCIHKTHHEFHSVVAPRPAYQRTGPNSGEMGGGGEKKRFW